VSQHRHPIPQMDELSDQFRELGQRESHAPPSRWRRWSGRRRFAALGVVGVALIGTAASATQWISIGSPEKRSHPDAPRYQPGSASPVIAATAPDSALALPWGIAIFDSRGGEQCAFAGQVRGERLGVTEGGRFRPYEGPTSATCRKLSRGQVVWSMKAFPTSPRRVIVFGRAGADVAKVRAQIGRTSREGTVGPGGAFLFVVGSGAVPQDTSVSALGPDGLPTVATP
jgi:hypothetical protein